MVPHRKQEEHGSPAAAGDWPWYSVIYHLEKSQPILKCGGNLINSDTVITNKKCIETDVESIIVQLGRVDLSVAGPYMQEFRARHIASHPKDWGMALIRLAGEVIYTAFVQPICLSIRPTPITITITI